ncbi:MAG: ATP-binding protein, partial [Ginsengibacter sp.]
NKKDTQGFYNFVYQPIFEQGEEISGIIVIATEVTEQILSRRKIEESEYRYHNLVHTSASLILILKGEDLVISVANDSMLQTLGKGKDLIGKPLLTVLPEIVEQGLADLLHNVFTTGESSYGYEVPVYILRNGKKELSYYTYVYQAQRDLDGKIDGVSVIGNEVTPQAIFNQKIKESEAQFRQMANLMPEKIINANAAGEVTYFNQTWGDYTGLSFEELKNGGWEKTIHPDEIKEVIKSWLHSVETGYDFEAELRIANKLGEYKWHLSRAVSVKDNNGKIKMWIGATTDIDDQKTKEETKDEFISIASHELRTPLTIVKAYVDLLQMNLQKTSEENLIYAQKAAEAVVRLNDLIGELLDVSKIQNGRLALNITEFDFNEMISSTIEGVQYASPDHTIYRSGKIKQLVKGDKERLQQVVINLLSNAVKYSPNADAVDLTMAEKNGEITVSVKDKGIGIKKENIGRIFERYYREQERAVHFQGLGIGLYISYEIVRRHNGKLWAESEAGQGSTFYFSVPINYQEHNL